MALTNHFDHSSHYHQPNFSLFDSSLALIQFHPFIQIMFLRVCLLLIPLIAGQFHFIAGQYEDEYTINRRAGIAHRLFDGDIDLRPAELELLQQRHQVNQDQDQQGINANGDQPSPVLFTNWITDESLRWQMDKKGKKGDENPTVMTINYTLDWHVIINENAVRWVNNILTALKNIEAKTCIRFRNSSEGDHIHYYWGSGCHSSVGRTGGKQRISLGPGCWAVNAVHETLHALGSFHEKSRWDRDQFIKIHKENILDDMLGQFSIIEGSPTGNPYDYGSVMHYNPKAFSSNTNDTIETIDKNYQNTIGWRKELSFLDARAINHRYCEHVCDDHPWHPPDCRNGGYANPSDCGQCLCPEGYAPPYCDTIQQGKLLDDGQECPGDLNILLSPEQPTRHEIRWFNAANFTCFWRVQAPADHYIEVKLEQLDGFACRQACYYNYLEIKYGSKLNAGPRFCCGKLAESLFTESYGHEVILIAHANLAGNYTIGLRYSITQ